MLRSAIKSLKPSLRGSVRGRDTACQILDAAEELLQSRGFNAFSYHHIAVRLGIRHAAVHYHFPVKEDLGVALIRRYRERFSDWCAGLAAVTDENEKLQQYFRRFLAFLDAGGRCCPGGVLAAEFDALPEGMRAESRALSSEHYDWLTATLQRGRDAGVFGFSGSAADKAAVVSAALQGGLQIARMAGPERFHQVLAQLNAELKPAYPASAAA